MKTVRVNLASRSYNIHIGKDVIKKIKSLASFKIPHGPFFIITNKRIKALYGKKLEKALKGLGKKVLFYTVPDSEKSKSFPVYIKTVKKLARFSRKAKPLIFAFGGGVIGDMAGFVASAYRRGVSYVQIPTTLLAQVDSAIGGKVAIDIKEAKNIVGNFYQPKMVLSNLSYLKTLPQSELRNGMAEVIKYGIIKDKKLFTFLEDNMSRLLRADPKALEYVVYRCSAIKASVVEKDESDINDIRAILNFGHTIGHAMESASGYSTKLKHGQAVAEGMIMASRIACYLKLISEKEVLRLESLIRKVFRKPNLKRLRVNAVLKALSYDKKFIYGVNRFILPRRIGHVEIIDKVPGELIRSTIRDHLKG